MTRGERQRQQRREAIDAGLSRQRGELAANRAAGLGPVGQLGLVPVIQARTTRFNSNGFTTEQLGLLSAPQGAQRVQLIISDPGYGKQGYRSTGWIDLNEFTTFANIGEDFGISLSSLRSVVFDNG